MIGFSIYSFSSSAGVTQTLQQVTTGLNANVTTNKIIVGDVNGYHVEIDPNAPSTVRVKNGMTVVKEIPNLYNAPGVQIDGAITPAAVTQMIADAVGAASIPDTNALINNPAIIKSGINWRMNDFATYTKFNVGTTITAGLNVVAAGNEFINTGKFFDKDVYSITITGTCGAVNSSYFGFGLRDSAGNFYSTMYRGTSGAVDGLNWNTNTLLIPNQRPSGPTYIVGDKVQVRVFLENETAMIQTAVNDVWSDLTAAPANAYRQRGELVLAIRTASTWNNISVNIQTKADYAETCYISPTGLVTNPGTAFAPTTYERALELTKGVGKIVALAGDYFNLKLDFKRNVRLNANRGDKVRLIYGERITSAVFTGSSTKVYEITHAAIAGTPANITFWQHDVADTNTTILEAENHPHHNGRTTRLESMKCTYLASVAALEDSDPNRSYWYQSGGKIYFTIKTGTNLATNPLVIPSLGDNSNVFNWLIGNGHKGVIAELKGIQTMYAPVNVNNITPMFSDCRFIYSRATYTVQFGLSIGGFIERCYAGGCFYSTSGVGDGWSATSDTGTSGTFHPFSIAKLIDCWGSDNFDDALSIHQYGQLYVRGFLAEYCGAGITIASGGHAVIENSTARKNTTTGFSVQGNPLDGGTNTNITLYNCVAVDNATNYNRQALATCKMTVINCISKLTSGGTHYSAGVDNMNSVSI